jgi:CTP:molybdopterin cytidylyltransferase MocA
MGNDTNTVTLGFGAISKPLVEQLAEQGFKLRVNPEWHQGLANSITCLSAAGMLTDGEADNARKRLLKEVAGMLEKADG